METDSKHKMESGSENKNLQKNGKQKKPKDFDYRKKSLVLSPSNNSLNNEDSSHNSNFCVICFETIEFFSLGNCNHKEVCSLCCVRLPGIFQEKWCPLCKTILDLVVFIKAGSNKEQSTKQFSEYDFSQLYADKNLGICVEDQHHFNYIEQLWRLKCMFPNCTESSFSNLEQLKSHIWSAHTVTFCDICMEFRKVFLYEQNLYTKKKLAIHYADHPLCNFCKCPYFSSDELYDHLHKFHETCFLCDKDGIQFQYFQDYKWLEKHFKSQHYLCPDAYCREKRFVVYRTAIDLQAHDVRQHLGQKKLTKAAEKKARKLNLEFNYSRPPAENATQQRRDHPTKNTSSNNNFESKQEVERETTTSNLAGKIERNNTSVQTLPSSSITVTSMPTISSNEKQLLAQAQETIQTSAEDPKITNERRNKTLVQNIKKLLGTEEAYRTFRQLSSDLLQNVLTPSEYYVKFLKIFGRDKSVDIFPELVALMPKSDKRTELLQIHDRAQKLDLHYSTTNQSQNLRFNQNVQNEVFPPLPPGNLGKLSLEEFPSYPSQPVEPNLEENNDMFHSHGTKKSKKGQVLLRFG